jgi:phage tail tape-measure protein
MRLETTKGEPTMTRTWMTSAIGVAVAGMLASACTTTGNTERGAATGAVLGGLAGAVIGNNVGSGSAGTGAAIGAVVGGAAGAAVGADQDRRVTDTRQYYDERAGRYYYYDPRTQRYYWENGEPRY